MLFISDTGPECKYQIALRKSPNSDAMLKALIFARCTYTIALVGTEIVRASSHRLHSPRLGNRIIPGRTRLALEPTATTGIVGGARLVYDARKSALKLMLEFRGGGRVGGSRC